MSEHAQIIGKSQYVHEYMNVTQFSSFVKSHR